MFQLKTLCWEIVHPFRNVRPYESKTAPFPAFQAVNGLGQPSWLWIPSPRAEFPPNRHLLCNMVAWRQESDCPKAIGYGQPSGSCHSTKPNMVDGPIRENWICWNPKATTPTRILEGVTIENCFRRVYTTMAILGGKHACPWRLQIFCKFVATERFP